MKTKIAIILGAALLAVPAYAQVSSVTSSNATTARVPGVDDEGDPNEMICRRVPPPLGTRLAARRQCATRAEWQQAAVNAAYARQAVEIAQTQRPCTGESAGGGGTCR